MNLNPIGVSLEKNSGRTNIGSHEKLSFYTIFQFRNFFIEMTNELRNRVVQKIYGCN